MSLRSCDDISSAAARFCPSTRCPYTSFAEVYAEETLRLGVDENGLERSPMRNAEARITLAVLAERAGDHADALAHGFRALESARQSNPAPPHGRLRAVQGVRPHGAR